MGNTTLQDRLAAQRGTSTTVKADSPAKTVKRTKRTGRTVFKVNGRKVYADATGRLHDAKNGAFVAGGKVTKEARKAEAKARKGKGRKTKATKVTKGAQAYGATGLTRKAWNATVSAKLRLAGKHASGVSFYALAVQDTDAWAEVRALRLAGKTPDEAVALVLANA